MTDSGPFVVGQVLYRYETTLDGNEEWDGTQYVPGITAYLMYYIVKKVTPKGGWIRCSFYYQDRFVLASGAKRFAYPTREEAWESLKARKRRRLAICKAQHRKAVGELKAAEGDRPMDNGP